MLSTGLSSTEFDASTDVFYATIDLLQFQKPVEMVVKVLDANGYTVNLENILACLDQMTVGIKGQTKSIDSNTGLRKLKSYLPCLVFKMPSKSRSGLLLKKFYQEIGAYEAELSRIRSSFNEIKPGKHSQSPQELRKKISSQADEIKECRTQINSLTKALARSQHSMDQARHQMKHIRPGDNLPPDIVAGTVRDILLAERTVVVRSGRKAFHLPMTSLSAIPAVGEECLIHMNEGKADGGFFYQNQGADLEAAKATVLYVDGYSMKIRDSTRSTVVISAKNPDEELIISSLVRSDEILIYMFHDNIIRFHKYSEVRHVSPGNKISEEIAMMQIEDNFARGVPVVGDVQQQAQGQKQDKKEEVA